MAGEPQAFFIAIGLGHAFWDTPETQPWLHSNDQHADIMSVAAKGWAGGLSRSAAGEKSFPKMYAALGCRLISSVKPFHSRSRNT